MDDIRILEDHAEYEPLWTTHERAMQAAVKAALRKHKAAGNTVVVWRNDRVVLVGADEIRIEDDLNT